MRASGGGWATCSIRRRRGVWSRRMRMRMRRAGGRGLGYYGMWLRSSSRRDASGVCCVCMSWKAITLWLKARSPCHAHVYFPLLVRCSARSWPMGKHVVRFVLVTVAPVHLPKYRGSPATPYSTRDDTHQKVSSLLLQETSLQGVVGYHGQSGLDYLLTGVDSATPGTGIAEHFRCRSTSTSSS